MIIPGRDASLTEARHNAETIIHKLGLYLRRCEHHQRYGITTAELRSIETHQIRSCGAGKGIDKENSSVEAMFSALQNYFVLNYQQHLSPSFPSVKNYHYSHAQNDIPFTLINQQQDSRIAVLEYVPANQTERRILIPLALSNPFYTEDIKKIRPYPQDNFDYAALSKYASPTGIAAGSTIDEAIAHSLYENIERICLGEFLLSTVGMNRPHAIKVVAREGMPSIAQDMLSTAENLLKEKVVVVDIRNDLGIPTYMAYLNSRSRYKRQFGLGCSLCPHTALIRAAGRILQLRIYTDNIENGMTLLERDNRKYNIPFESDSVYRSFSILNVGDMLHDKRTKLASIAFHEPSRTLSPAEHKEAVLNILASHGMKFFHTDYANNAERGFSCIHGIILPLDFTFLLSKGVKVSLSTRNLDLLSASSRNKHAPFST